MIDEELPSWPHFEDDEIEAVARVLRSGKVNYWTGTEGRCFEREFASYCGVRYAVAVANGSAALELALMALGAGPGDEVIVSPRTFVASASSIVLRGARPVFADVDPASQNITADSIREHITDRTRGIVTVHLAGWPCDMDPIIEVAREKGLWIIEDCAQAHGARYKGRLVGSFGDAAVFSFCQDKIMTTGGEGGMVVTNREDVWRSVWSYKDHGKNYAAAHHQGQSYAFRWLHDSFGTNLRMTEVQAAIGRVQLRKLEDWVARRRSYAASLRESLLRETSLRIPLPPADVDHSYYKFYTFVNRDRLRPGWSRDRLIEAIQSEGIPCFAGACGEVYREKAFQEARLVPGRPCAVAARLSEEALMFLSHHRLGDEHAKATARGIEKVFGHAAIQ